MPHKPAHISFLSTLLPAFLLFLVGCQHVEDERPPQTITPSVVDMSGYWEKNYGASDSIDTQFQLFLHDLQRYVRRNRGPEGQGQPGLPASNEAITGLVRFTEEITRMPTLEIEQDTGRVLIRRQDDYNLSCHFDYGVLASTDNPFGTEYCGWNGNQLLFYTNLENGMQIQHQVTLSPDYQQLNITTTVSSSVVPESFTISNYYRRYVPAEINYDCMLTISRNNVCTRAEEE